MEVFLKGIISNISANINFYRHRALYEEMTGFVSTVKECMNVISVNNVHFCICDKRYHLVCLD